MPRVRYPANKSTWITDDLRDERIERKFSQAHIADMIGVSDKSVSDWERGYAVPAVDKVMRWAEVLGYHLDLVRR